MVGGRLLSWVDGCLSLMFLAYTGWSGTGGAGRFTKHN